MTIIRRAEFLADLPAVLAIWREYIASIDANLDFQGNEGDFASLPGRYAPPSGCILLTLGEHTIRGCVAFRGIDAAAYEMKRLYVRPIARGERLGHELVSRVIAEARHAGYQEMRLDVLADFTAARRLYEEFGFKPAEPASFNPIADTAFLGLRL